MAGKKKTPNSILSAVTSAYIGLTVTIFLFYTGPMGYQRITNAKYSSFLLISGGYILTMLLLIAELLIIKKLHFVPLQKIILKSSWVQRISLIYLFLTWLSAIISPYFPTTIIGATRYEGALTVTIYVVTFLLISVYGQIRTWMLPVFALSVSLFDVLCILQLIGLNPFSLYPEGYNYFGANVDYGGAYLGTIGNVDLVAAFLCLAIPIFGVCLVRCRSKYRWFLLIPLGLSLVVLFKMWVLAGLVGIFAGGAVSLCVILPVSSKMKHLLWALLAGGVVAFFAVIFFLDPGSGLFHEVHLLLHGQAEDSFGSGRIYIWRSVLERIPEQFLFGSGPDTMIYLGIPPFSRFDEILNTTIVSSIDVAHNDYLNILFHQGILAVFSYLSILVLTLWRWIIHSGKNIAVAALGSATFSYCIQSFFSFSSCSVTIFFWIMLGIITGIFYQKNNTEGALC